MDSVTSFMARSCVFHGMLINFDNHFFFSCFVFTLSGMRVLSEQQKGNHRSATKNHAHMNNTSMSHSDSGLLRSGNGARGGYGYGSTSSDRTGGRNHSNGNSGKTSTSIL